MKKAFYYLFLLFSSLVFGCAEIDAPSPSARGENVTLDFTNYIAIGNSLTAGFSDGALYLEAQETSFPAILAERFQTVGLEGFEQPLMPEGNGANGLTEGNGLAGHISLNGFDESTGAPILGVLPPSANPYEKVSNTETLNNYGVPGLRVSEINIPGLGINTELGNPFFFRMISSDDAMSTYQQVVVEKDPTFFTCWLGSNDILGYASSGGVDGIEGNAEGRTGLTPISDFENAYNAFIDALIADEETQGVLLNLPSVMATPLFTTVPWNGLPLDAATANVANLALASILDPQIETQAIVTTVIPSVVDQLVQGGQLSEDDSAAYIADYTAAYIENPEDPQPEGGWDTNIVDATTAGVNQVIASDEFQTTLAQQIAGLKALGFYPDFVEGANPLIAIDETSPTGFRNLVEGELVLLTASSKLSLLAQVIAEGIASGSLSLEDILPALLTDENFLNLEEVENVNTFTEAYNQVIENKAMDENLVLLDINSILNDIVENPVSQDGLTLSTDFISGGLFSLDGTHLTPRGYSFLANEVIRTLNLGFGVRIPSVSISQYRGVIFPNN
ncbi:SGNH/GDSL hydrolase family protein [Sediminitomix flava]|uniref:GDSL-like lipase/acylhydrolase family protein n=1 Tax=Sediminitomix flava TaxID=379075 RepID=A0A315ZBF8_SEDFL|nr:SGNH/GDSL hydrolase family protein [Sediminitomix flava]PWJ42881.1 GDSL-like lipase/acylhydrolase family protein [Sediminitomix flava]